VYAGRGVRAPGVTPEDFVAAVGAGVWSAEARR
jgi:hypothetical protein